MFLKYLKAAWNAKFGMPVPASWIICAFVAVLAFLEPWSLVIGVGILAAYIYMLTNSARFQRLVKMGDIAAQQKEAMTKIWNQLTRVNQRDQIRYRALVDRCDTIVRQQQHETLADELKNQAAGLSRLASVYLQLLVSKTAMEKMPQGEDAPTLNKMVKSLTKRLDDDDLSLDVKKSLEQQIEIIKQRLKAQTDAASRLEYIEAELERIEQQIELLREQTVADTAPSIVSGRIDAVTSTLTGTNEWMKEHREMIGSIDVDALSEPPPIVQIQEY